MAKLLVTGGAGYIGSHTCKALIRAGHSVIVYDNLSRGWRDAVCAQVLEIGDMNDRRRLSEVISRHHPDGVLHFAALAYVGESVSDPAFYYWNNVAGTLTLLDAMRADGVNRLVFSSTCAIYGSPKTMPITEDTLQSPINPYGAGKLMIERILWDYQAAYDLRSIALRYFNAAGCDLEGKLGERHVPETHALPLAIQAAMGEIAYFQVMGTDYDTPDGTAIRDYVHVTDIARAHVLAIEHLLGGASGGAFNLGSGEGRSVLDIVRSVERVSGREVPIRNSPRRPGDPPILIASAEKAKAAFGWAPSIVDIDAITGSAWRWFTKQQI